jgi:hypothetical protein
MARFARSDNILYTSESAGIGQKVGRTGGFDQDIREIILINKSQVFPSTVRSRFVHGSFMLRSRSVYGSFMTRLQSVRGAFMARSCSVHDRFTVRS